MKQKIISFLSTCNEDIKDLCIYLYKNPETSYNESKSSNYICTLLEKYNFEITKNFLNINNSFVAKKGSGHPKICYLCEYDAIENKGHITGHNMVTAMSVEAALALGHVIDTIGGSVVLIGCPGEYLGGTKGTMVKQGVFDDIDVVMLVHPDTLTCESGSSSAIIPLGVTFEGEDGLSFLNKNTYTPLDSALLTINILNSIKKSFPDNLEVNSIISNGGYTPLLIPSKSEVKFYIRASNSKTAEYGDTKIRKIVELVTDLTEIKSKFFLYEYPNKELITNRTLNRLFSHNLKENGIINISPPRDIYAGLSIGDVSHKVPCIHPYVSIIKESSIIKYGSTDFAKATISDFALKQCQIVALSLTCTAIDLIKNETLLNEVKHEFFDNLK
ncbi:amidohydrolase [Clostridium saccharobutylicum]|uniref:Peptidase M20 domain-containing protein 2 n=1 Tax=Clostridium saccharobutylicum TaxID=169679 RepID=A0A1S8N458_CLOSA|nr:amidohydrolase [Clostridium saccharobutylicum]OOM11192.1 p-aminobenzoyl-glutamate hydrolase subunit B [Clostridium saccharobutylicum]